jgi:Tfp pilus assembly protein FimV
MATLNQIIAEQAKLIGEAKKTLETTQKKPPETTAPIVAKEATLAEIKSRTINLTSARNEAIKQFDEQIATYQSEIAALEKQIEEDKKRLGNQPPTPLHPSPRRGGRNK